MHREGMLGMEGGCGWRKVVMGGVHRKGKLGNWMSGWLGNKTEIDGRI